MSIMSEKDTLSHFKELQMAIFGFLQRETGAKTVVMTTAQWVSSCFLFVMYISVEKFEEHRSYIFGDILDSVFLAELFMTSSLSS